MDLIERYLQAVGRHLPAHQREDLLSELRSSLYDELERPPHTSSDDERAIALIKRMGPPRDVASAYHPSQEYLIGPTLYPFFKLVLGIVFTAVIVAQLAVIFVSMMIPGETVAIQDEFWNILGGMPFALSAVVVLFWVLQHSNVEIDWQRPFDPRTLPPLHRESDRISRGERGFGLLVNVIVLVIIARIAQQNGFAWNPVIERYLPWIVGFTIIGIGLDIVLLWQGYWRLPTRFASALSNLISLALVLLLLQGHNSWLVAANLPGLFEGLPEIPRLLQQEKLQLGGMMIFRLGLAVVAVIVAVETVLSIYRLLRVYLRSLGVLPNGLAAGNR